MAQNRRARKGAERLPRPRQRRLFCGVSIPCAAIYVSRLLVMGLPFWLLHDMLQRLAVERNSRDWAKTQVGVVFASYGVSLRLYRRRYAGYGEKHFALAERGRKPGGDARAYACAGYKSRSKPARADGRSEERRVGKECRYRVVR